MSVRNPSRVATAPASDGLDAALLVTAAWFVLVVGALVGPMLLAVASASTADGNAGGAFSAAALVSISTTPVVNATIAHRAAAVSGRAVSAWVAFTIAATVAVFVWLSIALG